MNYTEKGCPFDELGCFNPDLPDQDPERDVVAEAEILYCKDGHTYKLDTDKLIFICGCGKEL